MNLGNSLGLNLRSPFEGAMSNTKKPEVFEILYEDIKKSPAPWVVTSDRVVAAIRQRNSRHRGEKSPLSDKNVANFLKDFIRKKTCNGNWPQTLRDDEITVRQRYGKGQVLEFLPYRLGDTVPFPDRYEPIDEMMVIPVESLSIPRTARALGRQDEPWLIQVVVNQRIAHTHFAVVSPHRAVELTHLQMSVKTQPEIDAVFLTMIEEEGNDIQALITCEAKQLGERLLEDQIREQVCQAFSVTEYLDDANAIDAVIPVAVQVINHNVDGAMVRGVYFVEFRMIERSNFIAKYGSDNLHDMPLELESRAFYVMKPDVRGVSSRPPKRRRPA